MAVFRFVALICIVLGLMLLGADFVTMLETRTEPQLRSVEAVWALFSDTGVAAFKAWVPGVLPAPVPVLGGPETTAVAVAGAAVGGELELIRTRA